MKSKVKVKVTRLSWILLLAILFNLAQAICYAQGVGPNPLIAPIHGKLMLAGPGELSERVLATFSYLAGDQEGELVILSSSGKFNKNTIKRWKQLISKVQIVQPQSSGKGLSGQDLAVLNTASAVWLADDFSAHHAASSIQSVLRVLLRRDGVVGGQGAGAESIASLVKDGREMRDGFNLLPNSLVHASSDGEDQFNKALDALPGRVGWIMPPKSAVVIHNSRQISVISYPEITLRTSANGDWPERVASFGPPVDDLPYTTDLISWNRSGVARLGALFPPAVAPLPKVPRGALMIVGGHGFPEGMWEKVVEFAGGKEANYVCFTQSEGSTGADKLRGQGCANVAVHMIKTGTDAVSQGSDPRILQDLEKADAVYFGGGRTYKYMDAFHNTPAHELMRGVLERGGIILGGSAGAQIQGDFLVRGNPPTNNTLWMEGNDVGLGFIRGVIIDAHFRERGRENTLPSLLVKHPQMLGIGIDETTAIFVQGTTAEVLGPHSVTFYDLSNEANPDTPSLKTGKMVVLLAGEKYDLKNRKLINE